MKQRCVPTLQVQPAHEDSHSSHLRVPQELWNKLGKKGIPVIISGRHNLLFPELRASWPSAWLCHTQPVSGWKGTQLQLPPSSE
jgi:hypothetical protein